VTVANARRRGTLQVTADPAAVDVTSPEATVTVVPSVRLVSPYSLSVYDDAGERLA
jgi:hypothetical protein